MFVDATFFLSSSLFHSAHSTPILSIDHSGVLSKYGCGLFILMSRSFGLDVKLSSAKARKPQDVTRLSIKIVCLALGWNKILVRLLFIVKFQK
eukprot:c17821_g2_i1 orf=45-323(-)